MSATRALFGFTAAAAAFLLAAPAQARFGKHSDSSSSSESDSNDSSHSSESGSSESDSSDDSQVHAARPVNSDRPASGGHGRVWDHRRYDGAFGWGFGYFPLLLAPQPVYVVAGEDAADSPWPTVTIGFSGQAHNQRGMSLGFDLAVEGERWGSRGVVTGIFAPTEDGTPGLDSIELVDLHLTYALLSGPYGRLRLELGASAAFAPDISFLAPDVGASGALGIIGPLGFEASFSYAPWPFQRIDATAALVVSLGPVGLHAGWRHLWLDDRGWVDGVRHTDTFTGPFLGISFAL